MTTKIYKLPDGYIQVVNDTPPRYELNERFNKTLVIQGKGHYDSTTKVAFIEIFEGHRIPVPIVGEVELYGC